MIATAAFQRFVRTAIPSFVAMATVGGFLYAERIPATSIGPSGVLLLVPLAVIAAASLLGVAALHPRGVPFAEIVRKAVTPALLASGAYAHFLISGGRTSRLLILGVAAALVFAYLRELARGDGGDAAEGAKAFANLSHALHVLSVFFLSAFAFALTGLLQIPAWLLAIAGGITVGALTAETLRRNGIVRGVAAVSAAYGVLGTELFWAMTALPTPFTVNAAIYTILAAFAQVAAIRALRSPEPTLGLRRQAVLSAILIVILLLTARWR